MRPDLNRWCCCRRSISQRRCDRPSPPGCASGVGAAALPRITTLRAWIADAALDAGRAAAPGDIARRLALFDTLRNSAWLSQGLGAGGPAAMWALSRQLIGVGDELTRATFATKLDTSTVHAAIASHFRGRAHAAASPEADLVLRLWSAASSDADDPVFAAIRTMQALIDQPPAPLIVIEAVAPRPVDESAFLKRYAARGPLNRSRSTCPHRSRRTRSSGSHGPSCSTGRHDRRCACALRSSRPQARRGRRSTASAPTASKRKRRSQPTASCQWLSDPDRPRRVALIAFDRLVARRVRALLERADVLPVDESGWRLSTTTAAGALMRWLEIASPDGARCETSILLDWMKSSTAWADVDDKSKVVATIERALRAGNVARGWEPVLDAIDRAPRTSRNDKDLARMHVRRLRSAAAAPKQRQSLSTFFDWLAQALLDSGMRTALQRDRVSPIVLETIHEIAEGASYGETRFVGTRTGRGALRALAVVRRW